MSKADRRQIEIFKKMTPTQKLELAENLRETNIELLKAGIRSEEKGLSEAEVWLRALQRILPAELFAKVYGSRR